VPSDRQALFDAGGGVRALGGKYYAAYFPASYATSARRFLMVDLHGTGGAPETEWTQWASSLNARGWGYLGLKYVDDSGTVYDDEVTIYSRIKSMIDEVRAACDLGSASTFLVGFSRGSAQGFPVSYLDLKDRRFFKAVGNNSGAWDLGGSPTSTLQAIAARQDRTAFSGARFWMYCGERDFSRGWAMCDEMQQARDWIQLYGGSVATLFRDPTGLHGGLTKNPDALAQLFAYFEGL
jgi:hypothetical protein